MQPGRKQLFLCGATAPEEPILLDSACPGGRSLGAAEEQFQDTLCHNDWESSRRSKTLEQHFELH
jgi:hypothetical protein